MSSITSEEAAELRRLEAAVPPGEWSHDLDCDDPEGTIANDNGGAVAFMCPFASVHTIDRTGGQTFCHDEARLIPAARNALPRLLDEIDWQRAEIDRLRGLLSGDAEVKHMTFSPEKGCEVEVEHWAVKLIAESLFKSLGDAPNFVTMTVTHADHGPVEITIRRPEGKPVATVLAELRAEIDRLRAELAARPKLWIVRVRCPSGNTTHRSGLRADTIEIGSVDIGDCGDAVPCIAAFDKGIDASYVAACVGGTVEEWGAK